MYNGPVNATPTVLPARELRRRALAAAATACVVILVALAVPDPLLAGAGAAPTPPASFVTGEVLVKFRPGVASAQAASVLADHGARQVDQIAAIGLRRLHVPAGREEEVSAALSRNPNVLYAHPNGIIRLTDTIPNDPYYAGSQWNLRAISAPAAWDVVIGTVPVTVAVIDTGIDGAHPDLLGQTVDGFYQYTEGGVPYSGTIPANTINDPFGHGTHVSGIIAARTNNSIGVAGVSWGARLMPFRSQASDGSGTEFDLAAGLTWVTDHGARVVNISLGGPTYDAGLAEAVAYAWTHDVVVVAAAGNFSWCAPGSVLYPGAYPNVVAVAATDSSDQRASFSCYGPEVDLAAPGYNVVSTLSRNDPNYAFGPYGWKSGTSMASPHVAGLAALIRSLNPSLTNSQVSVILTSTTDLVGADLYVNGWNPYLGHGRINAQAAIVGRVALSGPPTADVGAPITYRLAATGSALDAAVPAVITAAVPAGAFFIAASDGGALAGNVVSWTVAPVAPLATVTRSLVVTATGTITASAYGGARGGGVLVAPPRNIVTRVGPELVVAKSGPPWVVAGEPITYTLVVTNTGVQAATSLVLTDALPAGAHLVSAGGGEVMPGAVVSWTAASLAVGARLERTLVITSSSTLTNADYVATCQESGSAGSRGPAVRTIGAAFFSYLPLYLKDWP